MDKLYGHTSYIGSLEASMVLTNSIKLADRSVIFSAGRE